ncbi:hypothetical protein ABB017_17330, partial [Acinetobacter baumannii]
FRGRLIHFEIILLNKLLMLGLCNKADLIGGKNMQYALDLLDMIDEKYFLKKGFCRNDLMPIAATLIDKDIFLIGKRNSSIAGKVIWYAGEEIEIFEKFNEFFLAMVDYNIDELNDLKV